MIEPATTDDGGTQSNRPFTLGGSSRLRKATKVEPTLEMRTIATITATSITATIYTGNEQSSIRLHHSCRNQAVCATRLPLIATL